MKRFAIIGHPVTHSLSPRIHAAFAAQTGIGLTYELVEADDFAAALSAFSGDGANVTLPYKFDAAGICTSLGDRAQRAGVVNTLTRDGDGWHGDNTDGVGLVRDFTGRHRLDMRERRTLLLGAGGGARGIAPALLDAGIADLFIVNRTPGRTDALADNLAEPSRVHPRYFDDIDSLGEFDLILNATSATRGGTLPHLPMSLVGRRTTVIDLSYGEAAIPFLAWGRAAGAKNLFDGLGMLVEQAAESFKIWHGVRPETDTIYAELRAEDVGLVSAD